MNNPYLEELEEYKSQHDISDYYWWMCKHDGNTDKYKSCSYSKREELVDKYSFAIPTQEAIEKIASFGKILEVGAGTGYWASLIAAAGAEVIAVDKAPVGGPWVNDWPFNTEHFDVQMGNGWEFVEKYTPEYTLFLCWPNCDDPFAFDCLYEAKGDHAIYVGEWDGGCTADPQFFALLGYSEPWDGREMATIPHLWEVEEEISLPQWPGIHDNLYILRRKV